MGTTVQPAGSAVRRPCPECGYLIEVPRIGATIRCTECGGEWKTHEVIPILPPTPAQRAYFKFARVLRYGLIAAAMISVGVVGYSVCITRMIRFLLTGH